MLSASRQRGFALVTTIILGVAAVGVMMALFGSVLNVVHREGSGRGLTEIRLAAEAGVDYAVKQLNDAIALQQACPIDLTTSAVPADYLPGFSGGTVKVRIRQLSAADWNLMRNYSSIYSPMLDPLNGPGNGDIKKSKYTAPIKTSIRNDYWRVIESTAQRGFLSRSVRVFVEPRFDMPPGQSSFVVTNSAPQPSYFQNALFGNSSVQINPTSGSLTVTGGSPSGGQYPLSVQSNMAAMVGNGATLQGDLAVSNNLIGAPQAVVVGDSGGNTGTVNGRMTTNSAVSTDFVATANAPTPPQGDNVLADADLAAGGSGRLGINLTDPLDTSSQINQLASAPVSIDSSAPMLPDLSGGAQLSGNYSATNLSSTGSTTPSQVVAPVKVFVDDGASSVSAVDIKSSAISNSGAAENFQIWYNGSRPVKINLDTNFQGLIYAPNAPVTLSGTGNFNGAIVGDQVALNGSGTVTIRTDLQAATSGGSGGTLAPNYMVNAQGEPVLQGYKAVSWQESTKTLVP